MEILLFILDEKEEEEKATCFPYGSFNWPIKNPYVSDSSPIFYTEKTFKNKTQFDY
jgi:hypothetical protein